MMSTLDHKRIHDIMRRLGLFGKLQDLEEKLLYLKLAEPEGIPPDVVTMNSEVLVHDMTKEEIFKVALVYQFSPLHGNQASVLSPLGSALLGKKAREIVTYKTRDGLDRTIQIQEILFQPESNGLFDL